MALEDLTADAQKLFAEIKAAPGQTLIHKKTPLGDDQFILSGAPPNLLRSDVVQELLDGGYLMVVKNEQYEATYEIPPEHR